MKTPWTCSLSLALLLFGCGGGGSGPSVAANVPQGSGQTPINMAGDWVVQGVTLVETNAPNPTLPIEGTVVRLGNDGILTIDGVAMARGLMEQRLGIPFTWYINTADRRTLLFGFHADVPQTGTMLEAGVAGGSMSGNRIEVESYAAQRLRAQDPLLYLRSRYHLLRVQGSPAVLEEPPDTGARLDLLVGAPDGD
jgi:hypothetical protein